MKLIKIFIIIVGLCNIHTQETNTYDSIKIDYENSFFDNIVSCNCNLTLPKNAELDFVIILGIPGLTRPTSHEIGTLEKGKYSEQTSTDIFGQHWELEKNELDDIIGIKQAQKDSEILIDFYKNQIKFLNLIDTSEITFLSTDKLGYIDYQREIIYSMFKKTEYKAVVDHPFTFINYNNTYFNPKYNLSSNTSPTADQHTKIGRIQDDYSTINFGTLYNELCSKFNIYGRNVASKDKKLVEYYHSNFDDILIQWGNSNNLYLYDLYEKNRVILNITENNLKNNLTVVTNLITTFFADFYKSGKNVSVLQQYLPKINNTASSPSQETINPLNKMIQLKKFMTYQVTLYSNLYSYLIVGPFLDFLIEKFNVKILRDNTTPSYFNKIVFFSVTEEFLSAIYKVFSYGVNTKNEYLYNDLPFIIYGFTVHFELWKVKDKIDVKFDNYFIVMREAYNKSPRLVIKAENFSKLLEIFMITPNHSEWERQSFCGM